MMMQRNCGEFTNLTPTVKKINRKITSLFLIFPKLKNTGNLFSTGDIQNFDDAIKIYRNVEKNIHLNGNFLY